MNVNSDLPFYFNEIFQGGIASILANIGAHPMGTVKTIQMVNGRFLWKQLSSYRGLYNGYIAGCGVDALSFAINNLVNGQRKEGQSRLWYALASGIVSAPFVSIGEFLMTNRQVGKSGYRDIWKLACRPGGLHKFNQGVVTTVFREIPFALGAYYGPFLIRDLMNKYCPKSEFSESEKKVMKIVPGAISGFVAGAITTPVDLVKTRVQINEQSVSFGDVIREVYKESGWRGFFRGTAMRSASIAFTVIAIDLMAPREI